MAIRTSSNAPPGSYDAVAAYLSQRHASPVMAGVDLENVSASEPYSVHIASLQELLSGHLPDQPRYWRHLIVGERNAVAEADVAAEKEGPRIVAIHRGPRVDATVEALAGARELDSVQKQDYELRLLEAPAIHLVALWLHSSHDDVLIPIEPDMTGLPRHQPISLQTALPVLRERASAVKQAETDYPGPSGN